MILFKNETESPNGVHTVPLKTLRRVMKASKAEPDETPVVVVRADGAVLRLARIRLADDGTLVIEVGQ